MRIAMIGSGYVGLVSGTCFAEMGNDVYCVDVDKAKINSLIEGKIPIYEPSLEEMIRRNVHAGRLHFTCDYSLAIRNAMIAFIAVGTPPGEDGSADIKHVLQAAQDIALAMQGYLIIVDKSTVPVGTSDLVKNVVLQTLKAKGKEIDFDVVSNPEFLKEGMAIDDFMKPDRIVLGTDSKKAEAIMKELYEPFVRNQHPVICMDIKSAEITKYAANAMLATRISFMNEIGRLCSIVGGDINNVRLGIGTDARIGMSFLYAGTGYGGSCFPKDVKELIAVGARNGISMKIAQAVEDVNQEQKYILVEAVVTRFGEDLTGRVFGLWGLAFKPQTDDMREAPSLIIIEELVKRGARLKAYDPEASDQARKLFNTIGDKIEIVNDQYEAINRVDALLLVTEWKQFRQPDFEMIKRSLVSPIIFDGRNQWDPVRMQGMGFDYFCIGRNV